ncbi:MAG: hypothetical protein J2P51_15810 [Hyphomicrobiaceae bacterium]|nr:hypothetical protein [Hyphomicrobiaceae bacterium]
MLGRNGGSVRRWVADFALAFGLFWAAALGLSAAHSRAHAISLPVLVREAITTDAALSSPANQRATALSRTLGGSIQAAETGPEHARLLLSLALATLAATNLGFWRHLRRVYASPRRRLWRRR